MDKVQIFECTCKIKMAASSKYKHLKSKKHFNALEEIKKNSIIVKKNTLLTKHLEFTAELMKLISSLD